MRRINPSMAMAATTLALVSLTAGLASADVTTDANSKSVTKVSGYSGKVGEVDVGSLNWGIKAVHWWEKGDKPCKLDIDGRDLYDPKLNVGISDYEVDICGGASASKKSVDFNSSERYYIRGIAVCTTDKKNSSDNRLKGIKIFPAKVTTAGVVTELTTFEKNERTNCAKWRGAVYCPKGHVAIGIKIHHSNNSFRGLALKCRKVITVRSSQGPER